MPTKTDIANIALAKFREGRITNIESNTDPVAVVMNDQYDHAIELLLEEHRWNFAGKRVTLSQLGEDPPFGWDYQHALPSDCIRLKDVNGESVEASSKSFTLEGRSLLTNDDTVTITYVAKIIDTTFFSPSFVEALAFKLASITCGRLTGDTELAIMLDKQYNFALAKAIHNDTKADGSREHNLMQRMMNSSPILGGTSLSGTGYTRTVSSTSGTVSAHKHELTDLLATGATDGQTIIWNDTDQIWEAGDAASGGDVSTDAIFDDAGDLVVGTGADTAVKLPIGANGLVLKSNGTTAVWDAIAGTGDVVGDASSVDNAITRFDGTTGKAIQNSAVTIDDSGNIATSGTVDGRDLSVDGTKLDTIDSGAEVNDPTTLVDADIGVNVQAYSADNVTKTGTNASNRLALWASNGVLKDDVKLYWADPSFVVNGSISVTGTVDGRDVSADGATLDAVVSNVTHTGEVTGSEALTIANRTGSDVGVVTGTAGTSGNLAQWNVDGDAVDSALATADVVTGSSTDTLTNKTIDGTGNTITNVSLTTGVTGDLPYANLVPATAISKLVGRGAAAGAGDMEEITLGTGLTMVGTTLSSSGGGGGSVSELSDLADVNTSTPTSGFALIADGVDFESRAITAADVSDFDTEVGNNSAVALNTAKATNVSTDLSYTAAPTIGTVTSSDGTDATLPLADVTNAGLLAPADFTKLGNTTNTNSGDQTITLTGDVTGTGTGSFATTIATGSVDIAMLSATGSPSASNYLQGDGTWATPSGTANTDMGLAVSDEATALTGSTTVALGTFHAQKAGTWSEILIGVTTAPTGSTLTCDVHKNGTTIFSTKPTIDATEKTSVTAATAAVLSTTTYAKGDLIELFCDSVGTTIAGTGLKFYFNQT